MTDEDKEKAKLLSALHDLRKRFKEAEDSEVPEELPGEYLLRYSDHLENLAKEQIEKLKQEKIERERAEEALKATEEKYRTLIENLNDMVYSTDNEGNITYMSPQIYRYGWMPEETMKSNLLDFVIPEDKDKVASDFQKTITTGEEFPTQFRVRDRNGELHWLEEKGSVQYNEAGEIVGLIGVIRDITESKKIEDELKRSEEKYRLLFESSPDSITIIDKNGFIIDINQRAIEISGLPREELIGKPFTELEFLDEDNIEKYLDLFTAFLDGEDAGPIEARITLKDGTEKWFEVFPSIIRSNNEIWGIQIITRDITARKNGEKQA